MSAHSPIPNSVLVDANIWASATLHAWFGLIAAETTGSWSFYWTEDILAEALCARRKRFPDANSGQIEAARDRLMEIFGDNQIKGFDIDKTVNYRDDYDAHVHSAAVAGRISYLVTQNVKDFQDLYAEPDDCPYELCTADEWLMLAVQAAPSLIDQVIRSNQEYRIKISGGKGFNLPNKLVAAGCPEFANHVRQRLQKIEIDPNRK